MKTISSPVVADLTCNCIKSVQQQSIPCRKRQIQAVYGARILFLFFTLFSFHAFSQSDNTSSPYSRYGYGQLADQTFASQRAMGGIGYGLRNSKMINPLNPASFSAVDSMTFMLDLGIKGQLTLLNDPNHGKAKRYNGGLEYIAMQFPLAKRLGIGIGLEPLSYVGYRYGDTETVNNETAYRSYSGKGGLSKIYTSLSYNLFNHLSLGVNIAYLFGDIIHDRSSSFSANNSYPSTWIDSLHIATFTYEAGLQYVQKLNKNTELVWGAVYAPKIKLNNSVRTADVRYDSNNQVTGEPNYYSTKDSVFQMPETYGIGFSYRKINKLTFGADFLYQRWANAKYYDKTDTLNNRMKINLGAEYIPNATGNNLFNKIHYRAGVYYADSYIIDNRNSKSKEYGVSLGLGIPMVDKRSMLNLAFEYSLLTPQNRDSMNEQYFKFTLSYTLNELWFFKRKLQ